MIQGPVAGGVFAGGFMGRFVWPGDAESLGIHT